MPKIVENYRLFVLTSMLPDTLSLVHCGFYPKNTFLSGAKGIKIKMVIHYKHFFRHSISWIKIEKQKIKLIN